MSRAASQSLSVQSLQSQHFAAGKETNGLREAAEFRSLALGGLDPGVILPALRGRRRLEVAQGSRVIPQRCLDLLGKL